MKETITNLCGQYHIGILDQKTFFPEKTIGIEDIRKLQEKLSLAPIQSEFKALIIYRSDTMSNAAQNAFLKTLEEPPNHTLLILTATTKEKFLPTILSRCTLLEEQCVSPELNKREYEEYRVFFSSLPASVVSEQLFFAQTCGKTKESTLEWLEKGIYFAREHLLKTTDVVWALYIRKLQYAHTLVSNTNANPRLVVEHMLLAMI